VKSIEQLASNRGIAADCAVGGSELRHDHHSLRGAAGGSQASASRARHRAANTGSGLSSSSRKRPVRFGIQSRLLLVALAIGSLFVLYIAFNTARQAGHDREHVREQMRLLAALAGARLDDHIGDVTQLLNALAGALPVERDDAAHNDTVLRALVPQLPHNVQEVSLWAADGSNIGSSESAAIAARPNASDRAFFISAIREPGLAIEAPVRWQKGGDWTAVFALRIVRQAQTIGVVSVATRLTTLPQLLDPDGTLPAGAVITLLDAKGDVVGRSIDGERWIGQPAPLDHVDLLRRMGEGRGSAENTGFDDVQRIFGFARSRALPWLVYVGIPLDAALATANGNARESLLLGLVMLGAGLFIAAWVAGRITRPLRQLSADARLLGEGRFEHRSQVRSGSEIGLLAHTLNRMAEALQERIAAARHSGERLSLALEGSGQALFDWDIANNRIHYSARASTLRGGPNEETEVTPEEMRRFVHPDDLGSVLARLQEAVRGTTPLYEAEFRVRHQDGHWVWVRSRGRIVERDAKGRAMRLVGTDADVSKDKAAEERLRQRAEFDLLTGLPNRALFNDRLGSAIQRARRGGKSLALLFLDVDHFKAVNDSHGHEAGDELLKIAAERLVGSVRGVDTVARLAGDEFTVILEGLGEAADAEAVATKLLEALRLPIELGAAVVRVSISIGLAFLAPGETDPASLLRRADEALYEAKRKGRDRYAISSRAHVEG
jgi:diguanylate cyclase (GGDEF)-like protein/PAS domain S-box-containing protein